MPEHEEQTGHVSAPPPSSLLLTPQQTATTQLDALELMPPPRETASRQRTLQIFAEADRQYLRRGLKAREEARAMEEAARRRIQERLEVDRRLEEEAADQQQAAQESNMVNWLAEFEAGPSDSWLAAREVEAPLTAAPQESGESIVRETQYTEEVAESEESTQPQGDAQSAPQALKRTTVPQPAPPAITAASMAELQQQKPPSTPTHQPPPRFPAASHTATSPVSTTNEVMGDT